MRIAYVTTDDVNREMATQLTGAFQATLGLLSPEDELVNLPDDGVIYDLDYLPQRRRHEILAQLLANQPSLPAAVHSYNLAEEQVAGLRENGVVVSRRLGSHLFRALTRA